MTLTKEYISKLKMKGNGKLEKLFVSIRDNNSQIRHTLENLGYLPKNFDIKLLIPFLENSDDNIRFWTVKNMGKVASENYITTLGRVAKEDRSSMVRREAVSALGRMRNSRTIRTLISFLTDNDPKIISQAIRGLLVFKNLKTVRDELIKLKNHRNEMIQLVKKEFFTTTKKKKEEAIHPESPSFLRNTVVCGDVREILKSVPNESVHLTFTSPPYYNARDYSIYQSYQDYLEFLREIFSEVYRITKEGRFFVLNTSPVIIPRVSRQHSSIRYPIPFDIHPFLIEMGWEFIDDIVWAKPESSVKNRTAGFMQHRKPLAYKPNPVTEMVMVYRKKTDKLIDWNIRQYNWKLVMESKVLGDYDTSNLWKIDPRYTKDHTAVFPVELCLRVIKYYSFKHDLVFDPFAGSGTVGKAANILMRYYFLTEIDRNYFEVVKKKFSSNSFFEDEESKFLDLNEFKKLRDNGAVV